MIYSYKKKTYPNACETSKEKNIQNYYCHLFTNVNTCKVEIEVCESSVKIKVYFVKYNLVAASNNFYRRLFSSLVFWSMLGNSSTLNQPFRNTSLNVQKSFMIYDKRQKLSAQKYPFNWWWLIDFQIANKTFADKEILLWETCTRYNKVKIKISDKYCIIHVCIYISYKYIYHKSIKNLLSIHVCMRNVQK